MRPSLRPGNVIPVLSGAGLVLSALVPAGAIPDLLPCPFKLLTGWPCPGCGLTHAICHISHGELALAWAANPFGFFFWAVLLLCLLWPLLHARFPRLDALLRSSRALVWAPPSLVVLMWAYDAVRIAHR